MAKRQVDAYGSVTHTHYHYDGEGRLIAETDADTGAFVREYVWLGLTPIATLGENPNPNGGGGPTALHYLHADHLGRPTHATDVAGRRVWEGGVSTPFGLQVSSLGAVTQAVFTRRLRSIPRIDLRDSVAFIPVPGPVRGCGDGLFRQLAPDV